MKPATSSLLTLLMLVGAPLSGHASERHFTHTYESAVLSPGDLEIEPWSTVRLRRDDYLLRFDHRLELELGVTERWQTAFYVNLRAQSERRPAAGANERASSTQYRGISWEHKLKVTDAVADAFGSALYVEGTLAPADAAVELKVILDKRLPAWLVATNVVAEYEWAFVRVGRLTRELAFEATLGASYILSEHLTAGIEALAHATVERADLAHAAVFAGPVASWSHGNAWMAFTLLSQVASLDGLARPDSSAYERLSSRLLIGIHL